MAKPVTHFMKITTVSVTILDIIHLEFQAVFTTDSLIIDQAVIWFDGWLAEIIGLTVSTDEELTHHLLPIKISCISFSRSIEHHNYSQNFPVPYCSCHSKSMSRNQGKEIHKYASIYQMYPPYCQSKGSHFHIQGVLMQSVLRLTALIVPSNTSLFPMCSLSSKKVSEQALATNL